jgi:hypothetical protein
VADLRIVEAVQRSARSGRIVGLRQTGRERQRDLAMPPGLIKAPSARPLLKAVGSGQ